MYEWVKAAHLIAVISWMVGFLYLPRLMVYHYAAAPGSETSETFKVMERRLLRAIMMPSLLLAWGFGLWLMILIEAWHEGWFVTKLFLVLLLTAFHGFAAGWVKAFARDERRFSQRFYRIVNEVPALFMVLIVILVIVKPF